MRTLFACAAFAAAVLPASAGAQTVTLTESEVLGQLGSTSPRIQAARAGVDVTRADILTAARWPNPRVTFNREAVAGVAENMLTVSQSLPITGRRRLEVSAATARAEASSSRAGNQIARVRTDLRLAFTVLWAAQERERELIRIREQLNELAAILGRREEAGDAAGFDRLRADREVLDVEASRAIAAAERAQAQAMVSGFLATPTAPAFIEAVRPAVSAAAMPTVDEFMARAEGSRGDLVALARELDAAGFAERAAARRAIPEP